MLLSQMFGENWGKNTILCSMFLFQSDFWPFTWKHCWSYGTGLSCQGTVWV